MRQDKQIAELADKFVLLRITYMRDTDIALFGYDYDQTWMTFFLNGEGRVYSRFGSRDASSAESYNSVEGLAWTMKEVLKVHKPPKELGKEDSATADPPYKRPVTKKPGDIPALHDLGLAGTCVRCHMIHEAQFAQKRKDDGAQKGDFWVFPPPENVGIKLDKIEGNLIREVLTGSAAEKSGLKVGDRLRTANDTRIITRADFEMVLNALPSKATLKVTVQRGTEVVKADLELADEWRRCDPSWRKSVRLTARRWLGNYDTLILLNREERAALKIPEDNLALSVKETDDGSGATKLPAIYRKANLEEGDVIVAFDGNRKPVYRFPHFYPMFEHVKGDKMEITFLRDGKEQTVTVTVP